MLNRQRLLVDCLIESDALERSLLAKAAGGDTDAERQYLAILRRSGKGQTAINRYVNDYHSTHDDYKRAVDKGLSHHSGDYLKQLWDKHRGAKNKLLAASEALNINPGMHLNSNRVRSTPSLLHNIYQHEPLRNAPGLKIGKYTEVIAPNTRTERELDQYIEAAKHHFPDQDFHVPSKLDKAQAIDRTLLDQLKKNYPRHDHNNRYIMSNVRRELQDS